jgi:hypothetical protein
LDVQASGQTSSDQFGVWDDAITLAYTADPLKPLALDGFTFTVMLQAQKDAALHTMVQLSDRITVREAYCAPSLVEKPVKMMPDLRFSSAWSDATLALPFELYQNYPNPFHTTTSIGFQLPGAGPVVLSLFNANGSLIQQQQGQFSAGYHVFDLNMRDSPHYGLFYYKIETPFGTLYRKLMRN